MIYIPRIPAPDVFTRKRSPALSERDRAIKHYSAKQPPAKPYEFTFYSSYKDEYKQQLIDMFNNRCAYCECYVTIGGRGDIEHFRPKGLIVDRTGKEINPGYYWLAGDWSNLYLSCTNCNQQTTFDIRDADTGGIVRKTVGKMNHFGLEQETFRRNKHGLKIDEEEQYRLLIDPCKENPEELLEFTDEGVIKPKLKSGIKQEKAKYSIDIYVLQRDLLVRSRKEKYLSVISSIKDVDECMDLVVTSFENNQHDRNVAFIRKNLIKVFNDMMDHVNVKKVSNEYIAVARQLVHPFLETLASRLQTLLAPSNRGNAWYEPARVYFKDLFASLRKYMQSYEDMYPASPANNK